jgi:hypothetical protein
MERSILNHFSTTGIILLFVGGMVVLTLAGVMIARRAFPDLAESRFDHVAENLRVVYELIFALILAFVIAAVLDAMGNAESTVATEATTIAQLTRENEAFPPKDELRVDDALDVYVHAVANDEWKTMRDGVESPSATAALEAVYAEYRTVDPHGTVQQEAYSHALDKLDDAASARRERLNIAAADLPTMLRVLVGIGIVLLLVLEYRPTLSRGASLIFMGALAAIITSAYLLTLVLNYPFAGDISVSTAPLKQDRLAQFWDAELQYRPAAGDRAIALEPADLRGAWNSNSFGTLIMRCYRRGDKPDSSVRAAPHVCRADDDWYGAYRYNDGVVTGRLAGGVFVGRWSEQPAKIDDQKSGVDVGAGGVRPTVDNSGAFSWRAVRRSGGTIIVGCWIYGDDGRSDPEKKFLTHPGWDLQRLGSKGSPFAEPADLSDRFGTFRFRSAPHVPLTPRPVHDCARRAL